MTFRVDLEIFGVVLVRSKTVIYGRSEDSGPAGVVFVCEVVDVVSLFVWNFHSNYLHTSGIIVKTDKISSGNGSVSVANICGYPEISERT